MLSSLSHRSAPDLRLPTSSRGKTPMTLTTYVQTPENDNAFDQPSRPAYSIGLPREGERVRTEVLGGFSILRGIHKSVVNRAFISVLKTFPTNPDQPPGNFVQMVGLLLEFSRYDAMPAYPDYMRIKAQRLLLKQLAAQTVMNEDGSIDSQRRSYLSFHHASPQAMIIGSCFAEQESAIFSDHVEDSGLLTPLELFSLFIYAKDAYIRDFSKFLLYRILMTDLPAYSGFLSTYLRQSKEALRVLVEHHLSAKRTYDEHLNLLNWIIHRVWFALPLQEVGSRAILPFLLSQFLLLIEAVLEVLPKGQTRDIFPAFLLPSITRTIRKAGYLLGDPIYSHPIMRLLPIGVYNRLATLEEAAAQSVYHPAIFLNAYSDMKTDLINIERSSKTWPFYVVKRGFVLKAVEATSHSISIALMEATTAADSSYKSSTKGDLDN